MKNRRIGLVDIGLDAAFGASMNFVQSIMQNVNAGYLDEGGRPASVIEFDFVRSRDWRTILSALTAEYSVLQVMAHGGHSDGEPTFWSSDEQTSVSVFELAQVLQQDQRGL